MVHNSRIAGILTDPVVKIFLATAHPEIAVAIDLALKLITSIQSNPAIEAVDLMIAEHIKKLSSAHLVDADRQETEIRLHELLRLLVRLGEI